MTYNLQLLCIAGPTASGKSSRAVEIALRGFVNPSFDDGFTKPLMGEIISVDSRQVYRGLDIGTEKITAEEMRGVPHHLIDIRDASETYSAGDFAADATRLIEEISARGKLPILVGGTHFYFDALLNGIPPVLQNEKLRAKLESFTNEQLMEQIFIQDPKRAGELDPLNRRRIIRALEIIASLGSVPPRHRVEAWLPQLLWKPGFHTEWIIIDLPMEELRARIDARLKNAFERGLIDEVRRVREEVGDARLNELGLEYKVVVEFLRNERTKESLLPALSAKLWQYARRQKAWLRKLGHPMS